MKYWCRGWTRLVSQQRYPPSSKEICHANNMYCGLLSLGCGILAAGLDSYSENEMGLGT
jgi:hypothetical protein